VVLFEGAAGNEAAGETERSMPEAGSKDGSIRVSHRLLECLGFCGATPCTPHYERFYLRRPFLAKRNLVTFWRSEFAEIAGHVSKKCRENSAVVSVLGEGWSRTKVKPNGRGK
jgi:hypothetical protein